MPSGAVCEVRQSKAAAGSTGGAHPVVGDGDGEAIVLDQKVHAGVCGSCVFGDVREQLTDDVDGLARQTVGHERQHAMLDEAWVVPEHAGRFGKYESHGRLKPCIETTQAVHREDDRADLLDGLVDLVDHSDEPLILIGSTERCLEVQAGGEEALDDVVVQVSGDAVTLVDDGQLRCSLAELVDDAQAIGDVPHRHNDEASFLGDERTERNLHGDLVALAMHRKEFDPGSHHAGPR